MYVQKGDIGAPGRVKPHPRRPHRELVTRVGDDKRGECVCERTQSKVLGLNVEP